MESEPSKSEASAPSAPQAPSPVPVAPAPVIAWQPLTPRGVAAFARASFNRLFLFALVVSLLASGTVVWFVSSRWFPQVRAAIQNLPASGTIVDGELRTPLTEDFTLSESAYLGFVVDLEEGIQAISSADLRVKFCRRVVRVCWLFGCHDWRYVPAWRVEFNRPELEPWWGAWQPIILGLVAVLVLMGLWCVWALLGTLYCLVVRPAAFLAERDVDWGGSWRLSVAALMPGALLFTGAIAAYGLGVLDMMRWLVFAALHFVIGWFYVAAAIWALPRTEVVEVTNPFLSPDEAKAQAEIKNIPPAPSSSAPAAGAPTSNDPPCSGDSSAV